MTTQTPLVLLIQFADSNDDSCQRSSGVTVVWPGWTKGSRGLLVHGPGPRSRQSFLKHIYRSWAVNCTKMRLALGSYSAPPDPIAVIRGMGWREGL